MGFNDQAEKAFNDLAEDARYKVLAIKELDANRAEIVKLTAEIAEFEEFLRVVPDPETDHLFVEHAEVKRKLVILLTDRNRELERCISVFDAFARISQPLLN
ncbi:MAG: hypothetical protein JSR72_03530 [Proteobacteria bacterium]|nr:hypothetical protein [Pseudomonadota bacterium]